RLADQRLLVVFGPSGTGKSSLIRAGLQAAVEPDPPADGADARTVLLEPGARPLRELAARLAWCARGRTAEDVHLALLADPANADMVVRQALGGRPAGAELVVFVDQFEEVFTLCREVEERALFVRALLGIALSDGARGRVVLGVRADFYGHFAQIPELLDAVCDRQFLLGPMSADELREAVTRPAHNAGLKVEPALVETVLADVGGGPGALPHLSHALHETWLHRRGEKLTLDAYRAAGGLSNAIARTADKVYRELEPQGQRIARSLLVRLTVGEAGEVTRRRVDRAELTAAELTENVLAGLTDARLVTVTEHHVELAHEALIHAWPEFQSWLAEDPHDLRLQRRLTDAAADWQEAGRDAGGLWRGDRFRRAQDWAEAHSDELTEREHAFLLACAALEQDELRTIRRRNRRLTALTAVLAVLLLVASAASFLAVRQQEALQAQRDLATAEKLAVQAVDAVPPLAALLSVESLRFAHTDRARAALLSSVVQPRHNSIPLVGHSAAVHAVALSADGRTVFSGAADRVIRRWNAATGELIGEGMAGHPEPVEGLALSQDGRLLVSGSDDDTIRRWAPDTGRPIGEPMRGHRNNVKSVAISDDGTMIVSGSMDGTIRRWDAASGAPIGEPLRGHDQVWSVAVAAKSRMIVSGGWDHTLRRWDAGTGAALGPPMAEHGAPVLDVAVNAEASLIVSGSQDGTVR
ncbi:MAG: hypothetical protein HOV94_13585, partial [Saccharothrix sp.]|nr:hypothetical protein [Saccharothrix sp.]